MGEGFEGRKCRRVVLNEYMDGVSDRTRCENDEAKCDICRGSTDGVDGRGEVDCEAMEEGIDDIAKSKVDLKRATNAEEEHEAKSEIVNDDEESESGRQSDDEAEDVYRRQQQQRQQVRERQQVQASQEGSEIEELRRQLRRWQGRCPMC